MKKCLSALLAVLLIAVLAGSALAADTGAIAGPPVLQLTLSAEGELGRVITGLTAATTPAYPGSMLLPLTREATGEDALLVQPDTNQPLDPDIIVHTGTGVIWTDEAGRQSSAAFLIRGDVLGIGTLNIAQLVRLCAHLNGSAPLAGLYLAAANAVGPEDAPADIADLTWMARQLTDVPAIGTEAAQEIIQAAQDWQTYGDTYQADIYHVIELKAGERILGMLPGQSAFYTNADTLEASGDSYVAMYSLLQMVPHPEFGYREQVGVYEVKADMWAATGYCLANSVIDGQWTGAGGGVQYVIPDYEGALNLVETIDLHA